MNKLYIKCYKNNTIVTVAHQNKTLITKSCGHLFFKKAKRGTKYATEELIKDIKIFLLNNNIKDYFLYISGFGKGRFSIIKYLIDKRITILKIIEMSQKKHNGCRFKKKRRI